MRVKRMKNSIVSVLVGSLALASLSGSQVSADPQGQSAGKLKVVIFGGHPDDPESGAGGLAAMLSKGGHEVILAYGTTFRGDRRFFDRPEAEVRQGEATAACKILGATPKFFPYAHEKLVADPATVHDVSAWLDEVKPDIVVTHWPPRPPRRTTVPSVLLVCSSDHLPKSGVGRQGTSCTSFGGRGQGEQALIAFSGPEDI